MDEGTEVNGGQSDGDGRHGAVYGFGETEEKFQVEATRGRGERSRVEGPDGNNLRDTASTVSSKRAKAVEGMD